MSKPTPPGDITPVSCFELSVPKAATPPIGKPYPQCMSGIARLESTIPGSVATSATCLIAEDIPG